MVDEKNQPPPNPEIPLHKNCATPRRKPGRPTNESYRNRPVNRDFAVPQGREFLGIVRPAPTTGRKMNSVSNGIFLYWRSNIVSPCGKCPDHITSRCPRYSPASLYCILAREYSDKILDQLRALPWIVDSDLPTVIEYIRTEIGLWVVRREIEAVGVASAAIHIVQIEEAYSKRKMVLVDHLGLSPKSRKSLGVFGAETQEVPDVAKFLEQQRESA